MEEECRSAIKGAQKHWSPPTPGIMAVLGSHRLVVLAILAFTQGHADSRDLTELLGLEVPNGHLP